jgi:hypothetical protein
MKKILKDVPYFIQTDNMLFASTTCYATCMAMAMTHCLQREGLDKISVGCPYHVQLEDYISTIIQSDETKMWIKRNWKRYGPWFLNYKPRTLAAVQEYVFNNLMYPHGYMTEFSTEISYDSYCEHIDSGFPVAIHGMFNSVSSVYGHIVLGIGYNREQELEKLIVNDPWGNALFDKYRSHTNGESAEYYQQLLMRDWKNKKIWGQLIQPL